MQTRAHLPFRGWHMLVTHAGGSHILCLARDYPSAPFRAGHRTSPEFANIPHAPDGVGILSLPYEYVSGLFDGEGWVRVQTPGWKISGEHVASRKFPSFQVVAGIAMTHKPLMLLLHDQFGGTLHGDNHYRRKNPKNRTIYRWHVQSTSAKHFLQAIKPYSICKLEQVDLALELQEHIEANKSKLVGRVASAEFKQQIVEHRQALALRITQLKKINYNLPDTSGAKPYHFQAARANVPFSEYSSSSTMA